MDATGLVVVYKPDVPPITPETIRPVGGTGGVLGVSDDRRGPGWSVCVPRVGLFVLAGARHTFRADAEDAAVRFWDALSPDRRRLFESGTVAELCAALDRLRDALPLLAPGAGA